MATITIGAVRQKYPQYKDLSDDQLAQGLHQKYYSDMPFEEFSKSIGLAKKEPEFQQEKPGLLVRVGRGFMDVLQGIKQAELGATSDNDSTNISASKFGLDPITKGTPKQTVQQYTQQVNDEISQYEKGRGPDAGMDVARMVGQSAATAPLGLPRAGASLASNVVRGALSGGAAAGANFDETGEGRGTNAALGAATGGAFPVVGAGLRKGLGGVGDHLSKHGGKLVELADKLKIPLDAAQRTGSRALEALKNVTGHFPFSGAAQFNRKQQDAYNRALAETMGETLQEGEQLTEDVLQRAAGRMGQTFDKISNGKAVPIDARMGQAIQKVEAGNKGTLHDGEIQALIDAAKTDFLPSAPGSPRMISGEEAQLIRSALTKKAREAKLAGKTTKEEAFKTLRNALDESIRDTLGPAEASTWDLVKRQYGNYKTVSQALSASAGEAGDVSGTQLWNAVKSREGRQNIAKSTSELKKLATLGKDVLKSKTPDSGTAQRMLYQGLYVPAAGAAAGAAGGHASGEGAGPGAAVGLAAGALTSRALRNQLIAKLMKEGVLPKNATASQIASVIRRYSTPGVAAIATQPEEIEE
jgi:hypothetical protein